MRALARFATDLPLEALARQSGFQRRTPKKLTPLLFLQSALLLLTRSSASLRNWASLIGLLALNTLSKQSLFERLGAPAVAFLQAVLAAVLSRRIAPTGRTLPPALQSFGRVLIQDSSCLPLSARLARFFPGSSNQRGTRRGQLKLQCILDLLSHRFVSFSLSGFRRNDQAAALDVLSVLRKTDLVLRDLGYFTGASLARIADAGAFFLSRLRVDTSLWEPQSQLPLDLLGKLRELGQLDEEVCLAQELKLRVRLVAIRLPPAVAAERRRKVHANRDRRCHPNARSLALLDWAIFVTNVPRTRMSARSVAAVYGLRWRIESIFKAWKGGLHLTRVPTGGQHALETLIYAQLILISVLAHVWAVGWLDGDPAAPRPRSLIKLTGLVADNLYTLYTSKPDAEFWKSLCDQVDAHGCYDRRRRPNFVEMILNLP